MQAEAKLQKLQTPNSSQVLQHTHWNMNHLDAYIWPISTESWYPAKGWGELNGHHGCTHSMHKVMCLHAPGQVEAQLKLKLCMGLERQTTWCICIQWICSRRIKSSIKLKLLFWWEIFTYIAPLAVSFPPHLFSYSLESLQLRASHTYIWPISTERWYPAIQQPKDEGSLSW